MVSILKFLWFPSDLRRIRMSISQNRYGSLWFPMVSYGFLWFTMVSYGLLWFPMVYYGFLWFTMVSFRSPPDPRVHFAKSPAPQEKTIVSMVFYGFHSEVSMVSFRSPPDPRVEALTNVLISTGPARAHKKSGVGGGAFGAAPLGVPLCTLHLHLHLHLLATLLQFGSQ